MAAATLRLQAPASGTWNQIGWVVLLCGALFASLNAFGFAFAGSTPKVTQNPGQWERMFSIAALGYTHTLGGAIASIVGPFQFLTAVRRRVPRVHVWLGRLYLVCVGTSALAGLYLSPGSMARNTFGIAFVALALAWLYTGFKAYTTIRNRQVDAHRRWMIRNYALTYAAVTLRLEMPLLIVFGGVAPLMALNIVGWLCWVPNLLLVEAWIRRRAPGWGFLPVSIGSR